ncbi:hypothetical protein [Streptomyces sp. 8N706]|uniref:hypothetical protein n=1 Tax=Streptomyces sp. 8N706 TaxID=3457416 RepID=UPI003FD29D76
MDSAPRMLGIYLNDHLAGATAGVELSRRIARENRRSARGPDLDRLADEIAEDRQTLLDIMGGLGVPARRYKIYGAWAGEKIGRFKPNGRVRQRSGLSTVVELEAMQLGVRGKWLLWRVLNTVSARYPGLDGSQLRRLLERAENQLATLESLHLSAASVVFDPARPDDSTA